MSKLQREIALSARLNHHRLSQALSLLPSVKATLLQQLPWLLQRNQPEQLGYVVDAPFGFVTPPITTEQRSHKPGPLLGLYTMGSTGSVGQGPDSDLDCWLIYPSDMSEPQLQALEQKCQLISEGYQQQGLDLHIFLLSPDWLSNGQRGQLSKEHSGHAQAWLLLEEVYRSHIRLAGKPLAWWPHAPQQDPQLLSLGELRHLPAAEVISTAQWQLFKGVERPHKALLKILLLESYLAAYPDLRIVRDELWLGLKAGHPLAELDHYQLIYQRIERYLEQLRDRRRLTLVQRCFYLKMALPLSQLLSQQDWRYPYVRRCIEDWRYTRQLLLHLDQANQWHAGQLQWFNERLDQAMLTSFQRLTQIAQRMNLPKQLPLQELTVISRRLSAQFDDNANKIPLLNPLWSRALQEQQLTLVAVQSNPQLAPGWYLYRQPPSGQQLFGASPLYHSHSRLQCVLWAARNGLIGDYTSINCHQGDRSWASQRLSTIGRRLAKWCQQQAPADFKALSQPWQYVDAMVVVNLEQDPSRELPISARFGDGNPLTFGKPARSLIGQLQLVTYNSWGETHCHQFDGNEAPLALINQLFSGIEKGLDLEVMGYARRFNAEIRRAITNLIRQAQMHRHLPSDAPWFVDLGGYRYGVTVSYRQLQWHRFEQSPQQLHVVQQQTSEFLPQIPPAIQQHARKGMMQVFVQQSGEHTLLHLLDGSNQLQTKPIATAELQQAIDALSLHTCCSLAGIDNSHCIGFELPQFYRLQQDEQQRWHVSALS